MTDDAFLEPHQVDQLTRHLRALGDAVPLLDAATARHASRPVGNLVRSSARPASTPPINVHALDLLDLLRTSITGWARCLADDAHVEIPADTATRRLCHHLATHADRIAQQPWAPDMRDEINGLSLEVDAVVDPREARSITDHHHLADAEVHHRAHHARGNAADMATVHLAVTGEHLPESTIRMWAKRGRMTEEVGPGGAPEYSYVEVAQLARMRRARGKRSA